MTTTTRKTRRAAPAADPTPAPAPAPPAFTPPEPVHAPVADDVRKVLVLATSITAVATQAECDVASEAHRVVRATAKDIAAFHKDQAKPYADAVAALRKVAAEDVKPWQDADARLSGAIAQFHVEQSRRTAAAEAAAAVAQQAEAEAVRASMLANLDAAAERATSPVVAAAIRAEAEDVAAAPLDVTPAQTTVAPPAKVAGQSVVTSYEAVVTDRDEAIAAIALPLVIRKYLPVIIESYVEGMTPGKARLARAELIAAAAEVASSVAAPSPEVLTLDQSALDVIAKRQGEAMLYPGLASRPKVGLRYRS